MKTTYTMNGKEMAEILSLRLAEKLGIKGEAKVRCCLKAEKDTGKPNGYEFFAVLEVDVP